MHNSRNFEQAREIFHEAISQCDRMSDGYAKWASLCLSEQARCEHYMKNAGRARFLAAKALKLSRPQNQLDALLACVEVNLDDPQRAEKLLTQLPSAYKALLLKHFSQLHKREDLTNLA